MLIELSFLILQRAFYITLQSILKTFISLFVFYLFFSQYHNLNNQNKHLGQWICGGGFAAFRGSPALLRYILKDDPDKRLKCLIMVPALVLISHSITQTPVALNST